MPLRKFITNTLFFLSVLLVSGCSGRGDVLSDAAVQKEITTAVNDFNSDNWQVRIDAVRRISKYSQSVYAKNSLLLIIKALDDSHSEVVIEALEILKQIKAAAAEEKISFIAQNESNPNLKYHALSALAEYRDIKNEKIFLDGAASHDWLVREASLKGLLSINDPYVQTRNLDLIIKAINDENISVKLSVIPLINIKNPLIYDELVKIINEEGSRISLMISALQKLAGYTLDDATRERIVVLLTHRDKNVRILSLQVLKQEKQIGGEP